MIVAVTGKRAAATEGKGRRSGEETVAAAEGKRAFLPFRQAPPRTFPGTTLSI